MREADDDLPRIPRVYGTDPAPPPSAPHDDATSAAAHDPDTLAAPTPPTDAPPPEAADTTDPSPGQATAQASAALFGRDLLGPAPRGWPFGARARARREQRDQARSLAAQRRAQLRDDLYGTTTPPGSGPWRPVSRGANARVIASLTAVVAVVMGLGWWATRETPRPEPAAAPQAPPVTSSTPAPSASAPPSTGPRPDGLPQRDPIPSGGVAPIVPPAPKPGPDPTAVPTVPVPSGPPTPAALSTPEKAAAAWMARWCPFDYRKPYGSSQRRAKPAMTELGWNAFNPADSQRGRFSWEKTVAARETARCSAPTAQIVPEAPRSPDTAMVQVTARRVVTGPQAPPYVETLTQTRIVKRGSDGLWWVGTASRGG